MHWIANRIVANDRGRSIDVGDYACFNPLKIVKSKISWLISTALSRNIQNTNG